MKRVETCLPSMRVRSGWGKLRPVSAVGVAMLLCLCLAAVMRWKKQQLKGISGQAARNKGMHQGIVVKSEGRGHWWSPPCFSLHSSLDVGECHVNGKLHKL